MSKNIDDWTFISNHILKRRAHWGWIRCPQCASHFLEFYINRNNGNISVKCSNKNCIDIGPEFKRRK